MNITFRKSALLLIVFILVLTYTLFEGAIRFYILTSSLSVLTYFIKGLMLIGIVAFISTNHKPTNLIFLLFVMVFIANGILINGYQRVFFTLFTFIPLVYFYFYPPNYYIVNINEKVLLLLLLVAVAGLLIDSNYSFVWEGYSTIISGIEISGNKQWTTSGIDRLAGFGRSSIETAVLLSFISLLFLLKCQNKILALFVICLTLYGINLTTTKGALLGFIFASLFQFIPMHYRQFRFLCFTFLIIIGNAIILMSLFDVDVRFLYRNYYSLFERINYMWPTVIDNMVMKGNIFGLGFGGVGVGASMSGQLGAAVDNFWLYIAAMFGLLFWLILTSSMLLLVKIYINSKY
jgi:hypothetical protein